MYKRNLFFVSTYTILIKAYTMNETIKKILIGKVFTFNIKSQPFVIVGVRKNPLHGYLEILAGRLYENKNVSYQNDIQGQISVYSWYCFQPKNSTLLIGRSNKETIRKCLKNRPDKIKYHIGKVIDISKYKIYDNEYVKHYAEYLKTL